MFLVRNKTVIIMPHKKSKRALHTEQQLITAIGQKLNSIANDPTDRRLSPEDLERLFIVILEPEYRTSEAQLEAKYEKAFAGQMKLEGLMQMVARDSGCTLVAPGVKSDSSLSRKVLKKLSRDAEKLNLFLQGDIKKDGVPSEIDEPAGKRKHLSFCDFMELTEEERRALRAQFTLDLTQPHVTLGQALSFLMHNMGSEFSGGVQPWNIVPDLNRITLHAETPDKLDKALSELKNPSQIRVPQNLAAYPDEGVSAFSQATSEAMANGIPDGFTWLFPGYVTREDGGKRTSPLFMPPAPEARSSGIFFYRKGGFSTWRGNKGQWSYNEVQLLPTPQYYAKQSSDVLYQLIRVFQPQGSTHSEVDALPEGQRELLYALHEEHLRVHLYAVFASDPAWHDLYDEVYKAAGITINWNNQSFRLPTEPEQLSKFGLRPGVTEITMLPRDRETAPDQRGHSYRHKLLDIIKGPSIEAGGQKTRAQPMRRHHPSLTPPWDELVKELLVTQKRDIVWNIIATSDENTRIVYSPNMVTIANYELDMYFHVPVSRGDSVRDVLNSLQDKVGEIASFHGLIPAAGSNFTKRLRKLQEGVGIALSAFHGETTPVHHDAPAALPVLSEREQKQLNWFQALHATSVEAMDVINKLEGYMAQKSGKAASDTLPSR